MSISIIDILEKYSNLVTYHSGPRDTVVQHLRDPEVAKKDDLVFVEHAKYLKAAFDSPASVLVINKVLLSDFPESSKTVLTSSNVMLFVARLLKDFLTPQQAVGPHIHPTAVIAPSAQVAETATIGAFSVIDENVRIGEYTSIGSHCCIQQNTFVGKHCRIHPHVFIAHNCEIHDDVEIHPQCAIGTEGFGYAHDEKGRHERIPHSGRVVLERDVHLGAGVFVDRGVFRDTRIGEGTKVDNACHFGHNAVVGKHCVIAGGLLMAGSSSIGDHVIMGGSVNIAGHIHVASGSQIAGFSTIGKSVEVKGPYQGYPLQPLSEHKRTMAALLTLPELRKDVIKILRQLNLKD